MLYLFADMVVEPDTPLSQKFVVPCSNATVKRSSLAGELFAIGFWNLQEQGKVALSMGKRTLMGIGRQQITASLQPGVDVRTPPPGPEMTIDLDQLKQGVGVAEFLQGLAQQVPMQSVARQLQPGETPFTLEDATLHQVELHGGTAPVRDIVKSWFGSDEHDPNGMVIDRVARELGELGFATGMEGGSLVTKPTITVDCGRRAVLEASAGELLERWRSFRDQPDGLGGVLVERCRAAISSMQESNE
jgi:hypothetical protein